MGRRRRNCRHYVVYRSEKARCALPRLQCSAAGCATCAGVREAPRSLFGCTRLEPAVVSMLHSTLGPPKPRRDLPEVHAVPAHLHNRIVLRLAEVVPLGLGIRGLVDSDLTSREVVVEAILHGQSVSVKLCSNELELHSIGVQSDDGRIFLLSERMYLFSPSWCARCQRLTSWTEGR